MTATRSYSDRKKVTLDFELGTKYRVNEQSYLRRTIPEQAAEYSPGLQ